MPENQDEDIQKQIRQLAEQFRHVQPESPAESTLYNFAFGALYAFGRAVALDYCIHYRQGTSLAKTKTVSMKRADEAAKLAANLAKETMPLQKALPASGQWLAGYYYNDALLGIDVCYEQVTRYFLNEQGFVDGDWLLAQALRNDFPTNLIAPICTYMAKGSWTRK